jgi:hypothetical protein
MMSFKIEAQLDQICCKLYNLFNIQKRGMSSFKNDVVIIKYSMIILITYNKVITCYMPQCYIII